MSYLVIDLGTTSIKTSLVDEQGALQAFALREYSLETPSESVVEFEAPRYWEYVKQGIRELISRPDISPQDIRCVSISSQAETLVVLDSGGKPLMKAIVWLDNRAHREARELEEQVGIGRTGLTEMNATWPAAKILWLKRNRPDVFSKAAKYLMLEDYIIYRLTGEYAGEYTLYSTSALLDIEKKSWWKEMLHCLGISPDQLTNLKESGTVVSDLHPAAAQELGLSQNTPVITGAMDQVAGMVGAGNIKEEIITETTGGAFVVCRTLDEMPDTIPPGTSVQCHALPGKYLLTSWCAAGGLCYTWLRDTFFAGMVHQGKEMTDESSLYDLMNRSAGSVDIGSRGLLFYPFLAGPGTLPLDPMAKGCFYGIDLHHTKAHFARAVMESIAFLLKETLEYMHVASSREGEIHSMGGGAKSELWNQMKADAVGLPVKTLKVSETASLGIAILSAAALGIYPSADQGVDALVQIDKSFMPETKHFSAYEQAYRRFRDMEHRIYSRTR